MGSGSAREQFNFINVKPAARSKSGTAKAARESQQHAKLLASARKNDLSESEFEAVSARLPEGRKVRNVAADGSCLFHALAHQLHKQVGVSQSAKELRAQVGAHLLQRRDYFAQFLDSDFDAYVKELLQQPSDAGELEISAFCDRFRVAVTVYTADGVLHYGDEHTETLHICYFLHFYGSAHYTSTESVGEPNKL